MYGIFELDEMIDISSFNDVTQKRYLNEWNTIKELYLTAKDYDFETWLNDLYDAYDVYVFTDNSVLNVDKEEYEPK